MPLPVAPAPQGLRPHSPLRFPRQPSACYSAAALRATTRLGITPDPTTNLHASSIQPALALPPVWWADAGHPTIYLCPTPTPFSTLSRCSRRMKRQVQASALGAPQHPPASCAPLAPKPTVRSQPRRYLPQLTHGNYIQTSSPFTFSSTSSCSQSLSHKPNTIEFA